MLLYEYEVRDKLDDLTEYARNVLAKWEAGTDAEDLLLDAKNLQQLYQSLNEVLPESAKNVGNLSRHGPRSLLHPVALHGRSRNQRMAPRRRARKEVKKGSSG